jgi:hypothetical protein
VFQWHQKFYFLIYLFLVCFVVLQVTMSDLNELVLMMERDPSCSMDTLYGLCESRLYEWIGAELSRERGDVEKIYIYDVG